MQKGGEDMSDKEEQILETIGKIVPNLSDEEKEKLLFFGEGMAVLKEIQKKETEDARK